MSNEFELRKKDMSKKPEPMGYISEVNLTPEVLGTLTWNRLDQALREGARRLEEIGSKNAVVLRDLHYVLDRRIDLNELLEGKRCYEHPEFKYTTVEGTLELRGKAYWLRRGEKRDILEVMLRKQNWVFSKKALAIIGWGDGAYSMSDKQIDDNVQGAIDRLRDLIERDSEHPEIVVNVKNAGYMLVNKKLAKTDKDKLVDNPSSDVA